MRYDQKASLQQYLPTIQPSQVCLLPHFCHKVMVVHCLQYHNYTHLILNAHVCGYTLRGQLELSSVIFRCGYYLRREQLVLNLTLQPLRMLSKVTERDLRRMRGSTMDTHKFGWMLYMYIRVVYHHSCLLIYFYSITDGLHQYQIGVCQ